MLAPLASERGGHESGHPKCALGTGQSICSRHWRAIACGTGSRTVRLACLTEEVASCGNPEHLSNGGNYNDDRNERFPVRNRSGFVPGRGRTGRGSGRGTTCVVCIDGGTEDEGCHYALMDGGSRDACDDGVLALAVLTELRDALEGDDITMVASALMRERPGVSAEFIPEGGRIDLILACDPNKPFWTIPVLPELRRALEGELQQIGRGEFTVAEPAP